MSKTSNSVQICQSLANSGLYYLVNSVPDVTMSQQSTMDLNVMVYSNEALMANGSYGESKLQVVTPQVLEEPKMGLIPQAQVQLVASLFGDQRIFLNAPLYQ